MASGEEPLVLRHPWGGATDRNSRSMPWSICRRTLFEQLGSDTDLETESRSSGPDCGRINAWPKPRNPAQVHSRPLAPEALY